MSAYILSSSATAIIAKANPLFEADNKMFIFKASDIENFVLVALHTQPKNAAVEIDKVDEVIRWTKKK